MTDIITKDEIKEILDSLIFSSLNLVDIGNCLEQPHRYIQKIITEDYANEIISKINENIEIARENEGDESQAQFHHLAQFVYLHGDKATKGMFKKLIKRMKGI